MHTPEPWTFGTLPVTADTFHHVIGGYANGRPVIIAVVYPLSIDSRGRGDDGQVGGESHANARLVTEAPNLLKTCKTMLEICRWKCSPQDEVVLASGQSNHDAMIAAMEVISRAEGGS